MSKLIEILAQLDSYDRDLTKAEREILAWVDEVIGEDVEPQYGGDKDDWLIPELENQLRAEQRKRARS
jgi:hypothetical protein